jgi:hypothetical protein
MLRRLLAGLLGREDDEREGSRFVPSTLDRSIRESHGSGAEAGARELAETEAAARQLEEADREHR